MLDIHLSFPHTPMQCIELFKLCLTRMFIFILFFFFFYRFILYLFILYKLLLFLTSNINQIIIYRNLKQ